MVVLVDAPLCGPKDRRRALVACQPYHRIFVHVRVINTAKPVLGFVDLNLECGIPAELVLLGVAVLS